MTDIDRETCTRDLYAQVEIDEVVLLCQLPVRQFGFVVVHLAYPSTYGVATMVGYVRFDNQVILRSCTFWYDVVGYVRDGQQQFGLSLFGCCHLLVVLRDLCFQCTGLRFSGFCLFALTFGHQHTDGLADLVHLRSCSIFLLLRGLTLSIKTKHFVDCLLGA